MSRRQAHLSQVTQGTFLFVCHYWQWPILINCVMCYYLWVLRWLMRPILALNCLLQIEQERSEEESSVGDALALAFCYARFCSASPILFASYSPAPLFMRPRHCRISCNLFPWLCWYVEVFKGGFEGVLVSLLLTTMSKEHIDTLGFIFWKIARLCSDPCRDWDFSLPISLSLFAINLWSPKYVVAYLLKVFGQTILRKHCSPRSDAAKRGVYSWLTLFATYLAGIATSAASKLDLFKSQDKYGKELNGLDRCSVVFTRNTTFVTSFFAFLQPSPEKESALKGKNLHPGGSKLFPYRIHVHPFLQGRHNNFERVTSPESLPIPLTHLCLNIFNQLSHHELWKGPLYSRRGVKQKSW